MEYGTQSVKIWSEDQVELILMNGDSVIASFDGIKKAMNEFKALKGQNSVEPETYEALYIEHSNPADSLTDTEEVEGRRELLQSLTNLVNDFSIYQARILTQLVDDSDSIWNPQT